MSIVSLLEEKSEAGGPIAEHAHTYQSLARREWFLWCFFFEALLDQAIYTAGRTTKTSTDRPKALKLCGILASYQMNLHPALLLLTASLLVGPREEEVAEAEFRELLNGEMDRYSAVLEGAQGSSMPEPPRVYSGMCNAMALICLPGGFASFSRRQPNLEIYRRWTSAVAEAIGERSR